MVRRKATKATPALAERDLRDSDLGRIESIATQSSLDAQAAPTDYESIVALGEQMGRPTGTLLALASQHDPFFAGRLGRSQWAEWYADLWNRFEFGRGTHLRRVHYVLISQAEPIICPDAAEYINTTECWNKLVVASRDARYLALVPVEDFDDRRNDDVREYLTISEQAAYLFVEEARERSADLSSLQVHTWLRAHRSKKVTVEVPASRIDSAKVRPSLTL